VSDEKEECEGRRIAIRAQYLAVRLIAIGRACAIKQPTGQSCEGPEPVYSCTGVFL